MKFRKWLIAFFALTLAALALLGSVTVIIDPFFHYHAPLEGLEYEIFEQRYQNHGILRHFDYDTVITGNSMCENFKSSQCDRLFGCRSVKVPFSGASSRELDLNLRDAFEARGDIRLVIMDVDCANILADKDYMYYEMKDYPLFLYDKNPINDVKYLFNKSIFKSSLNVLSYTRSGKKATSFDDYSFWDTPAVSYGRDSVMAIYERPEERGTEFHMNAERHERLRASTEQNYLETIRANPDTEFYIFFPPYGILFWDKQLQNGTLELQLEAEKEFAEMLLEYENVHLFSFMDEFELVCDFDRYKDYIHYDSGVNEWIMDCLASGEHELRPDNCQEYFDRVHEFYRNYDYDALFENAG
ncbi:MAG: hypothetical protein ACOX68_07240 [Candidatus Limivicinus sp.]|jgi:hypothetical protein